jgi:hypothetical protein
MAKTSSWRDNLWQFYEGVFGKNYRNYIHRFSNKENEVTVSFHVKGDELVVIASPSGLRVIKHPHLEAGHSQEIHSSGFSKKDLKDVAPLIKEAEPR